MFKKLNSALLFVLLFLFVNEVRSQEIHGIIVDKVEGTLLSGASVKLGGANKSVISNDKGVFVIQNVPNGNLQLIISHTGFEILDTSFQYTVINSSPLLIGLTAVKETLEEVIILSSSRTNSRIEDMPTKVEVLGAEEVKEENGIKPGNIASLLGDIAGIQIQQTNAATGNADMRIQGLQGKYTQILRDGMPLFGGYAGSFGILQIPPLDLQQIELIKGASSTLYGGGAIAGMLNLISKKPKLGKAEKSITLNYSSLKESNFNTFFSGRNKKTGYSIYAGSTQQNEVDVDHDGFSDLPAVKSVFIHPRFFIYGKNNNNIILGYTLNYEDRNGGDMRVLNGSPSAAHQFFIQNKTLRNTFDGAWEKKLSNGGIFTAKANYTLMNRAIITNVFGMNGKQSNWYSEIAYSKKFTRQYLVLGINFNGENFTKKLPDSSLLTNDAFSTLGAFIQDDWKLNELLTLQSGIRLDHHNTYGNFLLPRISLMYKVNSQVTMRIGGGAGYKTPSLFNSEIDERDYHYLQGFLPGIKSEKSMGFNYDINYKTRLNSWELTFNQTIFYNKIKDPIVLTTDIIFQPLYLGSIQTSPNYQYENQIQSINSKGMESYIQAIKAPYEIYLGYVYTDAKRNYNPINPNLPLIAKHKFATVITYELSESFKIGLESAYTGKQYLDNGSNTKPYLFMAMMIRYTKGKASIVLNCENLFDKRQNKNGSIIIPPLTNPSFPEIWAPLDGRVINLSVHLTN